MTEGRVTLAVRTAGRTVGVCDDRFDGLSNGRPDR